MLAKPHRLTKRKDFDLLYNKGHKVRGEYGMLLTLSQEDKIATPKFGYVINKKMGNAVQRHKLTRQLRSITKALLDKQEKKLQGKLYSYIAYEKSPDYQTLEKEFNQLISKSLNGK